VLKLNISNEDYAALDEATKAFYDTDGDNFKLKVDGIEDTGPLRRAYDRQLTAAKEAKERADLLAKELAEIRSKLEEGDMTDKRKKGDIEALEKSWKEKADSAVKAEQDKNERLKKQMETLLVGNVAQSLASELFTVPEAMIDFVQKRLKAEFDGDTPATRVLDASGQPSAATIDDFKKELLANPKLAGILVASKASGGDAGNGGGSGGNAPTKKFAELNEAERVALWNTNPEEFNRQLAASKG
jgi:hypothetical protein